MARQLLWVFAGLMLVSTSGRAAELCEATQQRAGSPSTAKTKGDEQQRGDKDGSHPGPKKWWIDPQLRAELGITDQQSSTVDKVWQKSLPKLREARERLVKLEDALAQLLARDGDDEAAIAAQIDRVETVRSEGNKARTLMIYRMHRVLTVEQRAKVKAMMERRDDRRDDRRDGGKRSPSSR
jgi:Spy/CpxP family protein refolding chaperone